MDAYQLLAYHTTPDSIQSHSDNPRHLPDTFQTPYRHPTDTPKWKCLPIKGNKDKRNQLIKMSLLDFYHYQLISHHIPPWQCLGHKLEEKTSEQVRFCSKYFFLSQPFISANIHIVCFSKYSYCVLLVYCVLKYWILRWLDRVWRVLRCCPIDPGYCQDSIADISYII